MPDCRNCRKFDPRAVLCAAVSDNISPLRGCLKTLLEKECSQIRGKVLEIGCGSWDFSKRLLEEKGCEWFSVDPVLVDRKGRQSIATHQGKVESLPFSDDFFDYVLGNQTMEHWQEYGSGYVDGLNEIYRVLKPGGTLSLNVPIHLHGDKLFIQGNIEAILDLFKTALWTDVSYEPWRQNYEPLAPYKGWKLCGIPDTMITQTTQSTPSSWLMQIRARKRFQINYQYTDRETKAKYVWLKYQSILGKGNILDVGADQCYLKEYIEGNSAYWGIGLGDNLDQQVDLEEGKIPFPDSSFDCVLCLDVLEHLENIHQAFDECCRITGQYFILSLPNPWASFFRVLRFGHYRPDQPVKFYGLPVEPPEDRHKWFFSSEEAENFVLYRARVNNMKVIQMDTETVDDSERGLKRLIRTFARSLLLRRDLNLRDLYAGSLWAVLEKKSS